MTDQTIDPPRLSDKLTVWLNRPTGVALTAFLVLSCAMVKFLTYNQYPILSPEIGLTGLFIALLSIGFGLAYRHTKWLAFGLLVVFLGLAIVIMKTVLTDGNVLLQSQQLLLMAVFVIVMATGFGIIYRFPVQFGRNVVVILLATALFELTTTSEWSGLGVLAAYLVTRRQFLPIVALFSITILITTPVINFFEYALPESARPGAPSKTETSGSTMAGADQGKPFILHLILDEHLGIEGFNSFTADPQPIRTELLEFYSQHGFQVFAGAYSRHFHTRNAMPEILRLGEDEVEADAAQSERLIDQLSYLKELQGRGYPLSVLQTDAVFYCRVGEIRHCMTYPASGPLPIQRANISALEKAKFILSGFMRLSPSLTFVAPFYDYSAKLLQDEGIPVPFLFLSRRSTNVATKGLQILKRMPEDLTRAEPATAFVAHILFPHFPYVYDRACNLMAFKHWRYRTNGHDSVSIMEREAAYSEQIRCSLMQLDLVLEALDNSPVRDNYVVIIHGDHGSRITDIEPTAENVGKFSDRDLIAGFSTLFAVRYPEPRPGYVADHISVDKLLKNLMENDFQAIHADDIENGPLTVVLDNQDWVPTLEYNLPQKWPVPAGSMQ